MVDKYHPLSRIVSGQPAQIELTSGPQPPQLFGSLSDRQFVSGLESRLFAERQEGRFIVFPPDVLGMASVYKLAGTTYLAFGGSEFVRASNIKGETKILVPDPAEMEGLEFVLPEEQMAKLKEFYSRLSNMAGKNGNLSFSFEGKADVHAYNYFPQAIGVYHNGARVVYNQEMTVKPGDVIRIGPSIVFGYFAKMLDQTSERQTQHGNARELPSISTNNALPSGERGIVRY